MSALARLCLKLKTVLRVLAIWLCLASLAFACTPSENALEIAIADFGKLYPGDLETVSDSTYLLLNGVCVLGDDGWRLGAADAQVTLLEEGYEVRANAIRLEYQDWVLESAFIRAVNDVLYLDALSFSGADIRGEAQQGVYDLQTGKVTLDDASAQGNTFVIVSERAELSGNSLRFREAFATTCQCEGAPLYQLGAETADVDLVSESITIQNGRLQAGGLTIALGDLTLSEKRLSELTFPLVIDYVGDTSSSTGTGLGIRAPALPLYEGLSLEVGATGIDSEYPFRGVLLTHYRSQEVRFDIGVTAQGPQADFELTSPLTSWLNLNLGITNRHWKSADFLHEGFAALNARQRYTFESHRVDLSGTLLAAGSSQTLSAPVLDARLLAKTGASYTAPKTLLGQPSLKTSFELSHYPQNDAVQYGVYVEPRWLYSAPKVSLDLSYKQQFSNSTSPFSTKLDKLEPESELSFKLKASPSFQTLETKFDLSFRYDFQTPKTHLSEGFKALSASLELRYPFDALELAPYLDADFAPLVNPSLLSESRTAFIELGTDLFAQDWETGFAFRINPDDWDVQKLELRGAYPLLLNGATVKPFLAFDVLPSLRHGELPRVSGHGLELRLPSCCGTFLVGYRQQENIFSTSFSVQFEARLDD